MTLEQLTNLKNLRDLGRRILSEPERYPLDLGIWDCGTQACLLGYYGREVGQPITADTDMQATVDSFKAGHFGLNKSQFSRVFVGELVRGPSPAAYAELECRLEYLDSLIAEHDKPEPKGIPSSVRRIFDEAQTA